MLPSVFGRAYLIMSLAELGRFAEAAKYAAEAIQIAEPTQHAHTIGWAYFAASMLHLLKGDWAKAHARVEHWIAMLRTGNVAILLPWAVAASAWVLAQLGEASEASDRVREGEQLLEHQAERGIVGHRGWAYGAVGRACLLLGRLDEARRLGDRAVESSRRQPGFTAHALRLLGDIAAHPDRFDAESGAAHYREALALARVARHAPARRPLPARPGQALPPHRRDRARPRESHRGDDDVPRDGNGLLARAGGGDMTNVALEASSTCSKSSAQVVQAMPSGSSRRREPPSAVPFSSLPHLLEHHAERIPDAPAILAPGRAPLSYGRLIGTSTRWGARCGPWG